MCLAGAPPTPEPTPPPKTGLETNLEQIDRGPEDRSAQEATRLEDHLLRLASPSQPINLAVGETVFLELDVAIDRPLAGPPVAAVSKSSKPGLSVLPVVTVEREVKGKKTTLTLRYAVRNQGLVGTAKLDLQFTLSQEPPGPNSGAAAVNMASLLLNGQLTQTSKGDIEDDRKAYLLFQGRAAEAYQALPTLHDYLRLDRVDRPPAALGLKAELRPTLDRFVRSRLYADIALARLRAAAAHPDPELEEAAILAIGALTKKPNAVAKKARAIEGLTNAQGLDATKAALLDLRIDEAEGFLDKLRNSGRLNRAELSLALELEGGVHAMRGRKELATVAFGRVRCLDPKWSWTLNRPFFQRAVAAAGNGCSEALKIRSTVATRAETVDGPRITVVCQFGPDPFRLVSGGEIQLWGSGGEVHSAEKIRTSEDGTTLEAEFVDNGELENYAGQVLVRVVLRDLSGVSIAGFGDPDPVPMELTGDPSGAPLPWYTWAIAGGVLAVGAATVGIVLLATSGETRGIGPIGVTF